MPSDSRGLSTLETRLDALVERGRALEAEGLPFPTNQVVDAFQEAVREGDLVSGIDVLKRAEALLTRAGTDWTWVRELLRRAD
ncbi:MAG TPA: hypothetical protein VEE83_02605, partial [Thermoplasmata archaeon]|nr:hypothetical protein [Thermoplasmata archaeon]